MRLVGTTKPTIQAIRDRTHWNSATLQPTDPVTLGLCSQLELDFEVRKAAKAAPPPPEPQGARLLSPEETTALRARAEEQEAAARTLADTSDIDPHSVFRLKPRADED
jgi:hypothetical protein